MVHSIYYNYFVIGYKQTEGRGPDDKMYFKLAVKNSLY